MPLLVVKDDPVSGTDTHNASGQANDSASGSVVAWTGTGRYAYAGAMTGRLSDFARIGGAAVAVTTSTSSLNGGETAPPAGGHYGPSGSSITPAAKQPITAAVPITLSLAITDDIGTGTPSDGTGSSFVRVAGVAALLDGDAIDSCDGEGATGNSSVAASTQNFVTASE